MSSTYEEVTKESAEALRRKAAAIEAATQRSDDPNTYRSEMEQARRMRAEADRIDSPARMVKPAKATKRGLISGQSGPPLPGHLQAAVDRARAKIIREGIGT